MSMPNIPEGKFRPNMKETIIDLLESIALEEIALSHLLNAEAEKIQAMVGKNSDFPSCPSHEQIFKFNHQTSKFLEVIVMKEWLLLRKLDDVIFLNEEFQSHYSREEYGHCRNSCDCDCDCDCNCINQIPCKCHPHFIEEDPCKCHRHLRGKD
ncbi:hypothetical protein [Bacillus weihaiensis]|uniref:hypothetical protein n=1 Tax=Bacillus weihaiensis TaxID=1547283 RepID=UPI000A4CC30B|nr:hypothetical protein [Bacillus weihaiensis]